MALGRAVVRNGGEFVDINGDGLLDLVVSEGNDMEPGYSSLLPQWRHS